MSAPPIRFLAALVIVVSALCESTVQAQAPEREQAAPSIAQLAFQLTPAAALVSRPITVDTTPAFSVSLTAASQTLQVVLVAPDGARYVVGGPASATFESGVFPIESLTTTPGASYLGTVTSPMPGVWSLEVFEPITPARPLDVVAVAMFNNDVRLVLVGGGDTYPVGTDIRFALVLFDGTTKNRSLSVEAQLFVPGDPSFAPVPLAFRDDGLGADETANDGIYEAFANPGRPGTFQLQAHASGVGSTGAFRRSAAAIAHFVERKVEIDAFTDRGIDRDFDGRLDAIAVSPTATVRESGDYLVQVWLRASNGNEIQRSSALVPLAGANASVDVVFETADIITDLGVDGPYQVAEVRFLNAAGDDLVPADVRYDLGDTAPYLLSDFQRARLRLTGTGAATGIDLNGNGLFDRLQVGIQVETEVAGFYSFSASLRDGAGNELGFSAGNQSLQIGTSTITFDLPGEPIGRNGADGPYFLSNLLLFGAGQSLIAQQAFTTQAFLASEFEGFVGDVTPPVLTLPGDIVVDATGPGGAVVEFTATAQDLVSGAVPVLCVPGSGSLFATGVTTVMCSAEDQAGNEATGSFTVTVVTRPPVAAADTASTLENVPVDIAVLANDADPDGGALSVTAVSSPGHGTAAATPAGIIRYSPAGGFFGTDTFTYTVSDGQGATATATVTVSVSRLGRFVALGIEELRLDEDAKVIRGDIGANTSVRDRRHWWDDDRRGWWDDDSDRDRSTEVRLEHGVRMLENGSRVVGDTVELRPRASVFDVFSNELDRNGATVRGRVVSPVMLPFVPLPGLPSVTTGGSDVVVGRYRTATLGPGKYRRVRVQRGGTLILTGGLYQVLDIDLDEQAKVLVKGASEVRVRGELDADSGVRILMSAPQLTAADLVIYVAGDDDSCGHHGWDFDEDDGGASVVHIGRDSQIEANIYAPEGTIWLKGSTKATGAFIAKSVRIGRRVELTSASALK